MFGKRLKQLREERGYSMDKLVELYNAKYSAKMNKSTLSRYENGLQDPIYTVVVNIADFFEVTIDYLTGSDVYHGSKTGIRIPVLGSVVAGVPIEAVQEILDYEEITRDMASNGEYFALKIRGNSMEPKFSAGDVVIIRKQSDVENGEIAIVLVNGDEATIKKIQKSSEGIALIPLNPQYDIMFYTNKEIETMPVSILGKVIELRAKF